MSFNGSKIQTPKIIIKIKELTVIKLFEVDNMNEKITEIVNKIMDDSSDTIPIDLLRDLTDCLSESEVYVPVDGEEIMLARLSMGTGIPILCDLDCFDNFFKNQTTQLFKFTQLEDFITSDMVGFIIYTGSRVFVLKNYLAGLAFNKNRTKGKVTKGYDVKVRLNDFRPLTWRDLIIPDNITFMELDDILKTLWGFNGHHLSCFLLRKTRQTIIDDDLASESMMGMDYNANDTIISEIFDKYDKITYWYDFGDDWQFDIEIKKKIDYDKDYVTIKRFKGKYDPIEDCKGVYGLSEIVYCAENPDEADFSDFSDYVEYLEEFDMEFTQLVLERKVYVKSNWHRDVYFRG